MDDESWSPRLKGDLDYTRLSLSAEEGYLLSRIDGATSVKHLTQLTGLPTERVHEILSRLTAQGALEPPAPAAQAAKAHRPSNENDNEREGEREGEREDANANANEDEDEDENDDENELVHDNDNESTTSHRHLFTTKLEPLPPDQRVERAHEATGAILLALCFDPQPRVIKAVLDNPNAALDHARLIAAHHRTGTGLGHLGKKSTLLRDRQVQRMLFRNPQLPEALFQRILQTKRMADVYRLALSREVTERVKANARKAFRNKFRQGTAEERVALLFSCEGRCLNMLIGLGLDGRTASLLIGRPMHSTLFVQNLARWPATPPNVLVHLSKQPLVRRSPALKNLVQRHPNAPAQLKRAGGP